MQGIAEPGREPTGDTPQMQLGSIAHKLLESARRPSPDALAAAGVSELAAVFECREWRDLAAARPERELPFIMQVTVNGTECWVRGRMDAAIVADGNGKGIPRVIDYKYALWTEGGEAKYEIQMTSYALALMKAAAADRAATELWYLKSPMKIIRREYSFGEAEEKLRGLLARYLNSVERNEWPAAERAYCDRVECGFRQQCWGAT